MWVLPINPLSTYGDSEGRFIACSAQMLPGRPGWLPLRRKMMLQQARLNLHKGPHHPQAPLPFLQGRQHPLQGYQPPHQGPQHLQNPRRPHPSPHNLWGALTPATEHLDFSDDPVIEALAPFFDYRYLESQGAWTSDKVELFEGRELGADDDIERFECRRWGQ